MGAYEPISDDGKQDELRTGDVTRLAKGASISTSGKLIGRGFNFLGQAILARLLGPEAFGLYAIGWTLLRIINIIGPLGLDSGVIRFGAKYWCTDNRRLRDVMLITFGIALLSSLVISLFLYLAGPLIAVRIFKKPGLENVLYVFAYAIPFMIMLRVIASATSVTQRLQYAIYSEEISQPASELVLILAFVYLFGWKLTGAALASTISFSIALILAVVYLIRLFPNLNLAGQTKSTISDISLLGQIMRFSIPTAFAGLFGSFISWADRLLVGYFRSDAETGIYTTISLVSVVFVIILSGIKVIFSPMIADLFNKKETERVEEIYRISTKWGIYISTPAFLIILFAPRQLLSLAFGPEYIVGALPLVILSVSQIINIATGPLDILLIMAGRQKTWLTLSGILLGTNIFLNSILIPAFGLLGAAVGTTLTVSGAYIIGLIIIKRELHVWPYDQRFTKVLIAVVVTVLALYGLHTIPGISPFAWISIVIATAILLFGAALLVQGLDAEDKAIIAGMKRKLKFRP